MPSLLIGETAVGMLGQEGDHMSRERAFAHIGERLGRSQSQYFDRRK